MKLRITRPALREAFAPAGQGHRAGLAPGDADAGLRPVPRGILFQGQGQLFDLPLGQGHHARTDGAVLRRSRVRRLYPCHQQGAAWSRFGIPTTRSIRTGVHAYRDMACADCHMPYRTEGGVKFTDHHLQSPLLNIANSCAVCHRWSEDEIRQPRGRHPGQGAPGARLGGNASGPGPFRHRRGRRGRRQRRRSWPASANWSAAPSCGGITWRPTTAWASTRRRSACGSWRRPIDLAGQCRVECVPGSLPSTASPSRSPIRISAPRKRPRR